MAWPCARCRREVAVLSRFVALIACALVLAAAACSPMTDSVPTLPPAPTETSIPKSTPTPLPSATPVPSATRAPSATPALTATPFPPTAAPTAALTSPVSKYFVPLSGQATGPAAVLALQRVEFWQEMTRVKPRNGLFVIFVGELRSLSGQVACAH